MNFHLKDGLGMKFIARKGKLMNNVWRRSRRTFSTHFEIFRRRVGIFSLFFLCCFYFLL